MNLLSGMNGLRAIAALLVVFYHLNQHIPTQTINQIGLNIYQFMGHISIMVSVFFILSGFFRSLSYWKNMGTPENIPSFFPSLKDRFLRIAPAYYVIMILSLIVTYILWWRDNMNMPAFFSGIFFLTWISPDTIFPVLINGPLWFISMDMMGWILTSLCMWWFFQIPKKYKFYYFPLILIATLCLHKIWITLPWPQGSGISSIWFPTYNPFLFFLHFLFGIGAAGVVTWFRNKNINNSTIFDITAIVSVIAISILIWVLREKSDWVISYPNWPYHFPWIPGLIAILMISLPFTRYIGNLLDNRFLNFTAKISYSLFLTHALIMVLLDKYLFISITTMTMWIGYSFTTLILSYIAAWLLYRYIEIPSIPKKS